jgi:hypothetical protein
VLNHNFRQKTWRISVGLRKRSERFGAETETICRKGRYRPRKRSIKRARLATASYVGGLKFALLAQSIPTRDSSFLPQVRSSIFSMPLHAILFGEDGAEAQPSRVAADRIGRDDFSTHPQLLRPADSGKNSQARPGCAV